MTHRVQINENIDIRKNAEGNLAVFSTDKNEFLKIKGKDITLDKDNPLTLVLPATHALEKLDLSNSGGALLIVENQGKSVELAGDNLAVMGNATMRVTQYELAGIDSNRLKEKKEIAVTADVDTFDDTPDMGGKKLTYGNEKHVVALSNGFGGRIDFVDAKDPKKKLLTLDGDMTKETQDIASDRVTVMQKNIISRVLAAASQKKDTATLLSIGMPEKEAAALDGGYKAPQPLDDHIHFWKWVDDASGKKTRIPGVSPVQDEKDMKKPFAIPGAELPDGRLAALGSSGGEKIAQVSPSNEDFQAALAASTMNAANPQIAYALAKMKANGGFEHASADQNSIAAPPPVPGASGERHR